MTGELFDAATLERWNVVNRVLPDEGFDDGRARVRACGLAEGPTRAHAATKAIVRAQVEGGARAADELVPEVAGALFATEDLQGAVRIVPRAGPGQGDASAGAERRRTPSHSADAAQELQDDARRAGCAWRSAPWRVACAVAGPAVAATQAGGAGRRARRPRRRGSGMADLTRVQLGRAADGRLRAALTLAAAWRTADLLARPTREPPAPPGSVCLRLWTVSATRGAPADYLACVTSDARRRAPAAARVLREGGGRPRSAWRRPRSKRAQRANGHPALLAERDRPAGARSASPARRRDPAARARAASTRRRTHRGRPRWCSALGLLSARGARPRRRNSEGFGGFDHGR